ncbi:uncharacterized protein DNG_10503 [Cephalotrichum gorgonifer]|uniref:Uncharacterized protein n=1 Tax=Cephalotrichum gorgonifer TaxID=2041049 RepID=A0AAE8N934_9PEZI|nr:uncharacterized protein DNG_10503 [Cephalotrichum gorgonifer]
MGTPAFTDIIS